MTRREYYLIAESLAKTAGVLGQDNLYYVADMMATELLAYDPAFKRDLFLEVAGVTKETIERVNA